MAYALLNIAFCMCFSVGSFLVCFLGAPRYRHQLVRKEKNPPFDSACSCVFGEEEAGDGVAEEEEAEDPEEEEEDDREGVEVGFCGVTVAMVVLV
jgi:hypothetical protein